MTPHVSDRSKIDKLAHKLTAMLAHGLLAQANAANVDAKIDS